MQMVTRIRTLSGIELGVENGSVTMDSRRAVARSADLTLTPTSDMSAAEVYALVMTPSIELFIERGLLVDGEAEYVPLGVFSTDSAKRSLDTSGTVSWTGSDRSKKIRRARFIDPYSIASGTSLATAGQALLEDRWSQVECDFTNVNQTIGAAIAYEQGSDSDPWQSAQSLFLDHGYVLGFDGNGVARAVPVTATTGALFSFGSGETSLIPSADLEGSLEDVYNGVVASGEGSDVTTAVRDVVWDTDPLSPTYYLGPYGKVPYFYSSPLLTTEAMCTSAATTMLEKIRGGSEALSWNAVVNPALEPLDCISATLEDTERLYVLDRLTVPLKASDSMPAAARETRIY